MIRLVNVLLLVGLYGRGVMAQDPTPAPTSLAPTEAPWSGCVLLDPNGNPEEDARVTIGEATPICLTLGPGGSWSARVSYLRWMFTPKADEYSRFRIPNSYQELVNSGAVPQLQESTLTVHSASQDQLSWLRVYWDQETNRIFPFLTAIIDVKNGVVQGIAWDDACVFCGKSRCLENTFDFDGNSADERKSGAPSKGCYYTKKECDTIEEGSDVQCDILLYVVWTGTDSNGDALLSSANRFSAFPPGRLQDRISQQLPDLPDNPFRD